MNEVIECVCSRCQCPKCILLWKCDSSCEDCERHIWLEDLNNCPMFLPNYKARRKLLGKLHKKYIGILHDKYGYPIRRKV